MEYFDIATKAALKQVFDWFIFIFLLGLILHGVGAKLRSRLSKKMGDFYDYFILPGRMCHEFGRTLGCFLTGTKSGKFELFNLETDASLRIPVAASLNSKFAFLKRFVILSALGYVLKSKSRDLIGSMFVVGILLVMASLATYAAEHDAQPQVFKNAFSGLWWAVATLTTVGYGDIYPVTVLGRVFGALIALLGIGMVAIPTGIISSGLVDYLNSQKEKEESEETKAEPEISFCPHCGKKIK